MQGGRVARVVGAIGRQVVDPVYVGQLDPGPRQAEFQVDRLLSRLDRFAGGSISDVEIVTELEDLP